MGRRNKTANLTVRALLVCSVAAVWANLLWAAELRGTSWETDAEWRYAGAATIRGGGNELRSVDELFADLKCVLSPQITEDCLLRFGVEWQRFDLGVPDRAPVPAVLQTVRLLLGLDYQLTDKWLFRAEVQPGIYSDFQNISWRAVDAPVLLGAAYLANADLQWFFGMRIDARSRYPVLPAAGLRWRFKDDWTLNLVVPNPRLEWDLNDKVQLYLGGGIELGTYTVGDHFGDDSGRPELNRATMDHAEIRVGPGVSWKIRRNFSLEAEAGYVVYRRFSFHDEHLLFRGDPAPYAQIAAHFRF